MSQPEHARRQPGNPATLMNIAWPGYPCANQSIFSTLAIVRTVRRVFAKPPAESGAFVVAST